MKTEATEVARISGRHALLMAFFGAVASILTTVLSSEVLRDYVKRQTLRATPQEQLQHELTNVVAERNRLLTQLADTKSKLRTVTTRNDFLEKDMTLLLSSKGVPPSRVMLTYRKFDGAADECSRIGKAALRLTTNTAVVATSPTTNFSTIGSYKASVLCFPVDKFVIFLGVGPDWEHAGTLVENVRDEFAGVYGK